MSHISRVFEFAILVNFSGFLDFASIKFRDFSQIAKLAKFNTLEMFVLLCTYFKLKLTLYNCASNSIEKS